MTRKGRFSREQAQKDLLYVYSKLESYGRIRVCGSFRRGLDAVGDLDIIVTDNEENAKTIETGFLHQSIKAMADEILASGQKLIRIILPSGMQGDFYIAPERLFGSHSLFLTGSKQFNILCRGKAKRYGWRLSQYGLLGENGTEIAVDELEILDALGMSEYANPATRSL